MIEEFLPYFNVKSVLLSLWDKKEQKFKESLNFDNTVGSQIPKPVSQKLLGIFEHGILCWHRKKILFKM